MFGGFRTTMSFMVTQFRIEHYTKWFSKIIFKRRVPVSESIYDCKSDRICVIGRVDDWQQLAVLLLQFRLHASKEGHQTPKCVEDMLTILDGLKVESKRLR